MKRILSAAVAAAALIVVTGCEGREASPTQVSTSDPSAGITSNYTSQSLQAEIVTTTAGKTAEITVTETVSAETETSVAATTSQAVAVSSDVTSSAVQNPVKTTTTTAKSSSGGVQTAETTTVSSAVQTTATTITSSSSQTQEPTTRPAPAREEIIEAYKNEISNIIDSMEEGAPENVYVFYTLYDMDGNGIPELIVKSGTDEGIYQDTYYTYDVFGIKSVSTGGDGSHSIFAFSPDENRFVSAYSYVGTGSLSWMEYDGSEIQSVMDIEFEYDSEDTFESQISKYGVERLPFALYTYSDEELTMIYRVVSGGLESDEIAGRDFSFIDNFDF